MEALDRVIDVWHQAVGVQPAPSRTIVLLTAALALAVIVPHPLWRTVRHVVTIAHEGGHALVALVAGRRLTGIRLHSDTSGLTVSKGRPTGPGMVFTLLGGYVTPSLLGLAGAAVLTTGRITLLLWLSAALLAAMLLMIRNAFGVLSVLVTGAIVLAVSALTSPAVQSAFAYTAVWVLLIGGIRPVFELNRMRRRGRLPYSDADQLGRLTGASPVLWVGVFLLVSAGALATGALLLTGRLGGWTLS